MQIHQILIRPEENTLIILYKDLVGNADNIVVDSTGNATVAALISECQAKLPSEEENPAKEEVEQEIAELEYRLGQLKESIGVT